MGHVTGPRPLQGQFVVRRLGFAMVNMYTNFEVSRPFQGRFVICRLGIAMFNPRIKFGMSTITCNEEMKATPNVKILVLTTLWGT